MRAVHLAAAFSVPILWGGNYIAAKYSVAYFPPFFLTALRFCLVSVLTVPFVRTPTCAQMKQLLPISVMSTLHFSLLFAALFHGLDIPSAALVGQLGMPFACLLGAMLLKDRIGFIRWGGIALAFSGIFIVVGAPNILGHMQAFYFCLASTMAWSVANILIKRISGLGSMQMLAWVGLCNVPMLFVLSLILEPHWPPLHHAPLSAWCGLAYTALASTIIAWGLWYYLLGHYNVSQVTPFSLLVPIFSIAFGQIFFYQTMPLQIIMGGVVTIAGVTIIVLRRPKTFPLVEAT